MSSLDLTRLGLGACVSLAVGALMLVAGLLGGLPALVGLGVLVTGTMLLSL